MYKYNLEEVMPIIMFTGAQGELAFDTTANQIRV